MTQLPPLSNLLASAPTSTAASATGASSVGFELVLNQQLAPINTEQVSPAGEAIASEQKTSKPQPIISGTVGSSSQPATLLINTSINKSALPSEIPQTASAEDVTQVNPDLLNLLVQIQAPSQPGLTTNGSPIKLTQLPSQSNNELLQPPAETDSQSTQELETKLASTPLGTGLIEHQKQIPGIPSKTAIQAATIEATTTPETDSPSTQELETQLASTPLGTGLIERQKQIPGIPSKTAIQAATIEATPTTETAIQAVSSSMANTPDARSVRTNINESNASLKAKTGSEQTTKNLNTDLGNQQQSDINIPVIAETTVIETTQQSDGSDQSSDSLLPNLSESKDTALATNITPLVSPIKLSETPEDQANLDSNSLINNVKTQQIPVHSNPSLIQSDNSANQPSASALSDKPVEINANWVANADTQQTTKVAVAKSDINPTNNKIPESESAGSNQTNKPVIETLITPMNLVSNSRNSDQSNQDHPASAQAFESNLIDVNGIENSSVFASSLDNNLSRNSPTQANYTMNTPFKQPGWSQEMGNRLVWMANQDIQSAQITVNPENLGTIQIQIEFDANKVANIMFFSAQSEVRQALQSSMSNLNSLFAESGISLGQTNVGSETARQQFQEQAKSAFIAHDDLIENPEQANTFFQGSGLINTSA